MVKDGKVSSCNFQSLRLDNNLKSIFQYNETRLRLDEIRTLIPLTSSLLVEKISIIYTTIITVID